MAHILWDNEQTTHHQHVLPPVTEVSTHQLRDVSRSHRCDGGGGPYHAGDAHDTHTLRTSGPRCQLGKQLACCVKLNFTVTVHTKQTE